MVYTLYLHSFLGYKSYLSTEFTRFYLVLFLSLQSFYTWALHTYIQTLHACAPLP